MKNDDDTLLAASAAELARREAPITLVLRPSTALRLAGLLQLVRRHPHLDAESDRMAVTLIEHVREYFAGSPSVLELLRRGDDPHHDQ